MANIVILKFLWHKADNTQSMAINITYSKQPC